MYLIAMNARYKELKSQIRNMCKPAFVQLCDRAGLSNEDKDLLVPFYFDRQSEEFIADMHGMSKSAYQTRKKILIERILSYKQFISMF